MANQQQHQNHGLNKTKVAVVMVAFPAQGHLNQLLHLWRLILAYNISVHYACTATHNHQTMLRVHGWDPNSVSDIHFHDLKIPPFLTTSQNPNAPNKFPSHLQPLLNASLHLCDPMASLLRITKHAGLWPHFFSPHFSKTRLYLIYSYVFQKCGYWLNL